VIYKVGERKMKEKDVCKIEGCKYRYSGICDKIDQCYIFVARQMFLSQLRTHVKNVLSEIEDWEIHQIK
jgi:hypothetical protein